MGWFGLKGAWLTFWVTVACATDMTLFGYDQGVFGGVIVTDDFLETMGIVGNDKLQSTVTAIYDIGCFLGAISTIWIGERLGRKNTILVGTTIMSIGAILQTAAFGLPQMFVGRVIAGIGNGINTSTAPVWQGETSKATWRGKLIVIEMIMNIFGFSLSNWVTYGFSFLDGSVSWRVPLAFQFLFIFIIFGTVPWLPESPRWLVAKGRVAEAEQILADLEDRPVDDAYIQTQSKDIQWAVEYERMNTVPWSDLLRSRTGETAGTGTVRRLILGIGCQIMQQLSGINITSYYLPLVLINSVGLSNSLARLLAACNSISYLLFSLIGIPNVERWGRRKMMMYAAFGQFVCYAVITVCIRYNEMDGLAPAIKSQWAKASIAFFFGFYGFFAAGWQGVPWLYPTEINSLSMRTKGAALGTAANWIFNFMVVEITPPGINALGWKFYIIWTVLNFSFVPIVYFFYPETSDRSLEDLDRFFAENQSILVFRDKDAISSKRPLRYIAQEEEAIRQRDGDVDDMLRRRGAAEKLKKGSSDEEMAFGEHKERA
ncbi:general substrate transporter [Colletotrichum zoysiae]|uniref:General substrate transporter n=1 Tax=Colletotrichum zoysiae TaxID=1216348 RepID=A0AAD9LZA8_9PEZI|nr:general substrate transporter [Colletotrichum zoysiae]